MMFCRKEQAGSGPSWSYSAGSAGSAGLTEKTQLLRKRRKRESYSLFLLHTLGRSFGPTFLCGTLCLLLHDAFMFAVPQVLRLVSEVKVHRCVYRCVTLPTSSVGDCCGGAAALGSGVAGYRCNSSLLRALCANTRRWLLFI